MANKKKQAKSVPKEVLAGQIFRIDDTFYDYIMVLSARIFKLSFGDVRECVAWNSKMCRRYDSLESDLQKCELVGQMSESDLEEYIVNNKNNEWEDPKIPRKDLYIGQ